MKRWLHWLLRIENNMSPFSIKHPTSWNESESFESQFTVFFTYKITVCWVGTSKVGRINCIELTGNWENNISIFSHEEPPYYCRNSKSNTCTFWVPLLCIDLVDLVHAGHFSSHIVVQSSIWPSYYWSLVLFLSSTRYHILIVNLNDISLNKIVHCIIKYYCPQHLFFFY